MLAEPAYLSRPPWAYTYGPEVADLAALAGFPPDPEQELALDAIFAVDTDGKAVAFESAIIAPRQNLKTGLFKICALGWLFLMDERLVVWSAHEFGTTQEAHRELVELIEGYRPFRKRLLRAPAGNNEVTIELHTRQRVRFKARTATGGRGLGAPRLVLDEAFALSSANLASLLPLMLAQPDPQVVYGSSAGLASSAPLRAVRDRGRPGTDPRLFYMEYCDDLPGGCVLPKCDHMLGTHGCRLDDERRWARANPQMGRRIQVETLRGLRTSLSEEPLSFAREVLGEWDEPDDSDTAPGISMATFAALADMAEPTGKVTYGVATHPEREWSAVCAAWRRQDGGLSGSLVEYREGATWVGPFLAELRSRRPGRVLTDPASDGLVRGAEVLRAPAKAFAVLSDQVAAGSLRHTAEPALMVGVRGSRWQPHGDSRILVPRGSKDISPARALSLALWGQQQNQAGQGLSPSTVGPVPDRVMSGAVSGFGPSTSAGVW